MKLRIGVIGGSIAGCSAAILLLRAGHEVKVFERSKGNLVGRGGGIGTPSAVLNSLIEQDIIDTDFPHFTTTTMPFTGRRSMEDQYGHTPWSLPLDLRTFHWSALWKNLRKRVPDQVYHQGQRVIQARMTSGESVLLKTETGEEDTFDLVLFADGYQSLGRQILFPEVDLSYRGYMLWRGLLNEEEMPADSPLGMQVPRLSHAEIPGHTVMYFIPSEDGSIKPGERIFNWAAYLPLREAELGEFMIDIAGRHREGTIPPGKLREAEELRLKQLAVANLPSYYGAIIDKTQGTYVQLIYTCDLPAYHRDRMCLIGDAGMVVQPFTGSGVFKGYNNVKDLLNALDEHKSTDDALRAWGK